ncbi:MAG: DUF21 domain-containing protein [Sedimentisphaerales bacterium]|nr:DUF21 domain-containing protein [Sedimentisphaerales bacterium]
MKPEHWLIFCFLCAVAVSFLCSLLEAVLLTVSQAYIESLIQTKHKSGQLLALLKHQINRPLAAILTLNTIANTVGAAGVGALAAVVFGSRWVAAASAILTLTILIFSEIIPKTLGAVHARKLAPMSAYVISFLMKLLLPLVWLLETLSRWLTPKGRQVRFSRDEMFAAAQLGLDEGTLLTRETQIIHNLLGLHKLRVKDILTPRSVVIAWQKDLTVGDAVRRHSPIRFSRIPIYGKDLDDITGAVLRFRVLEAFSQGRKTIRLHRLAQPLHLVPDTKTIADVLDEFIKRREHLFVVVDEYGGTAGIVTLEDAVESLLGVEIVDEVDAVEDMRELARRLSRRRQQLSNQNLNNKNTPGV